MPISSKVEEGVDYEPGFPEDLRIEELFLLVDSWTEALRKALISLGYNPFTGTREQKPEYADHFEGRTVLPDGREVRAYFMTVGKFHDGQRVANDRLELSITPVREDQHGISTVSMGENLRLEEVRLLLGIPSHHTKWVTPFYARSRDTKDPRDYTFDEQRVYIQYARLLKQILDLHFQHSLGRVAEDSTDVTSATVTPRLLEASEVIEEKN
ncbi:MAG: hypothetical protein WC777_00215 [Candidatus Gracilibacteria bacterium]|jgi:hypothetical protein